MANRVWAPNAWSAEAWKGTVWYVDPTGRAWRDDAWANGAGGGTQAWYGTAWANNSATLNNHNMPAGQGSITLSGQAVGFGVKMPAETGYYSYVGDGLTYRDILLQTVPIVNDSFALSGQDATLSYGKKLTAEVGLYNLYGQNVSSLAGINMAAQFEHYAITMQNVSYTSGIGVFFSNTYTLTGQTANLKIGYRLTADTGTYAYTGTVGHLIFGIFLGTTTETYTLTGQDASFSRGYYLNPVTGYYDSNGGQAKNPSIIDHPDSRHLPAGGVGKRKKRDEEPRKRVIEIDGEEFVVDTEEEAIAILSAVKDLAEQKAKDEATTEVTNRLKSKAAAIDTSPIDLSIPTVLSNDAAFQAQVGKVIEEAYKRAEIEAEVAVRLAKQRLLDEEDNLVLLLLNQ